MRIISQFRDYYDVVQKEGQDQTLIYIRDKKEVEPRSYPFVNWYNFKSYWQFEDLHTKAYTIGFCGKVYSAIEFSDFKFENVKICFTLEEANKYLDDNLKSKKPKVRQRIYAEFKRFFEDAKKQLENSNSFKHLFEDNRSPVFIATIDGSTKWSVWKRKPKIVYNASLKELEFFRVVDPYQAFQEINMWMSNQAMPEKVIPEMPDSIKVFSKGFDKFSFRKDKAK